MSLLKLIGVLLDYPRDELWEHGPELLAACDDPALAPARQRQLRGFVQALLDSDPLDAQARWLGSFDRGRSMSLLLFEHIHGESRDRGQAMVEILVEAGDGKVNLALLRQRASEEARDDTREAMDRLWEEEAVRFGSDAPAQDCAPPRRSPARPSHPEVQP